MPSVSPACINAKANNACTLILAKVRSWDSFKSVKLLRAVDTDGMPTTAAQDHDYDEDGAEFDEPRYELDLQSNVLNLDLDEGDKVELLESKTPHAGTKDFWDSVIRIALLSFDIPYTMYDGRGSSFSHVKMDRSEYFDTVQEKRRLNAVQLRKWLDWKLDDALAQDDRIEARMRAIGEGYDAEDLADDVEIVPLGNPWMDQKEELETLHLELAAGVNSRQNFCRQHNRDFRTICKDLEAEQKDMDRCGIKYTVGIPGADVSNNQDDPKDQAPTQDANA